MPTLSVQAIGLTGLNPTYASADAGGDEFVNNRPNTFIHLKNGGGANPCVVTIDDPTSQTPEGATSFDPDVEVSVPFGENRMIGPLPGSRFNDSNGKVQITYDQVVSCTVAVVNV